MPFQNRGFESMSLKPLESLSPANLHADSSNKMATSIHTDRAHQNAIRVLIADDHHLMRQAIRNVLSKESDIQVVGEANNGIAM
jgi:PleD family two-component response regulator